VPTLWHWSCALHTTGLLPVHVPVWQVSLCVHALPSVHAAPSAFAGLLHTPLVVSHVPALWHWSCALQTTGLLPVHVPVWQVSACVHASPSLHAAPLALAGLLHVPVPELHTPALWHWSCAVQTTGLAPVHAPVWHVSACVHASPSLHAVPSVLAGLLHAPVLPSQVPAE
jgi:hypothetical protein